MSSVIIYSTRSCSPCRVVARRFEATGVAYTSVYLDDPERADELAALKARLGTDIIHTPTLEVDGKIVMQGLDADVVRELIEARK